MSDCGCHAEATSDAERRILRIALSLNATMLVVGLIAALMAQSMGLIADALDMLADASGYDIALLAWQGGGVPLGAVWHLVSGSHPDGGWMMGVASVALLVNVTVLLLLGRFQKGEIHLQATWLFTRVDVIANAAVIMAGALVWWLHSTSPDLIIGAALGGYVIQEPFGILREADETASESADLIMRGHQVRLQKFLTMLIARY